ncbi:L-TYPE LECTIN-DOMAIN CONTAINING RECEPTOR KINASE V.9-LIKE [Salix purpurea]|uniref:L-TYPE LECTIN-DOMAIN CONTAINING RECEPTOR KINASE V.9-LIKE n=1 Tax=Salix purpurea TaxID=77065 RepID=A0A9Q0QE75_SALPP|nr:L-TYPE LECTIN-DOMAIN CONTAINING RECEPTOR KINASE V.9-LIKE [Salix purpurea]
MFYKCYVGLFLLMFKVAASIENGFVVNGNFELGGGAEFSQNGLFRLTNSSTFGVGRAFYSQPLNFKNSSNGSSVSFSTTFVFAFVLDEEHLPCTNNGDPSNHVVAIELDTFQNAEFKDINSNHVGIDVNSLESVKSASAGYFDNENGEFKSIVLSSGEPIQAWVEYDAPETQLNVTLAPIHTSKPSLPLLSLNIDISPIILEQMYVGFSSSTGQLVQSQYVLGWSFRLDGKAPELDLSKLSFFTGKEQSKRKGRGSIGCRIVHNRSSSVDHSYNLHPPHPLEEKKS